jgi:YVTN family beta-propeller protein
MQYFSAVVVLSLFFSQESSFATIMLQGSVRVGESPIGIDIDLNTNKVYVINYNSGSVSVIDDNSSKILDNIELGVYPDEIVVNSNTSKIYVANKIPIERPGYSALDVVSIIDGNTHKILGNITGNGVKIKAINEATNVLYMISNSSFVTAVDGNTHEILGEIELDQQQPFDIAIDENTNMIYIVSEGEKPIVTAVDGNTHEILGEIELDQQQPFDVAVDENTNMIVNQHTNRLYLVANIATINGSSSFMDADSGIDIPKGVVYTIDTKSSKLLSVLELIAPRDIDVNTTINRIYTINSFNKAIYSIDGYTDTLLNESPYTGNLPAGIAVNSNTGKIYVADPFDNNLYIFSEAT